MSFPAIPMNRTRMNKVLQVAQHFPVLTLLFPASITWLLGSWISSGGMNIETWDMDEDLLEMLADVATKLY
jgi:hypothetical protein